jgi:hypothetical protein
MFSNSYFFVIGGFDGQKVNDMYRIKVCSVFAEPKYIQEEIKTQ